jgi:hypothetical protein
MTTFEIVLTCFLAWGALVFTAFFAFTIMRTKIKNKAGLVKSHREIWLYYSEHEAELKDLLNDDAKVRALTGKERQFATMLTLHAELAYSMMKTDMVYRESNKPYMDDFAKVFNKPLMRAYWEETKSFRLKSFAKKVDESLKK